MPRPSRLPPPFGCPQRAARRGVPPRRPRPLDEADRPITSRIAYAAAHVVPTAWADNSPGAPAVIDWDATLAYRHELWSYGLGVADAMDTAQRGMGLDWAATRELITRSGAEAHAAGGAIACGAGTDQLDLADLPSGQAGITAIIDAYREQIDVVTAAGANVILMASRALARTATGVDDYLRVYETLLDEVDTPVILHWLGTMFDPALQGYWGVGRHRQRPPTFSPTCCRPRRARSTGSRCRCWTPTTRSRCAAACRPGSGCTPGTTSTTRS